MNINDDRFQDLSVEFQGDTVDYTLTFTDDDGNAINITNWSVWMTIKENLSDADADAVIQEKNTTHDDAANGLTVITLSSTQTEDLSDEYWYDFQYKDDMDEIHTFLFGHIRFSEEVTTSTS